MEQQVKLNKNINSKFGDGLVVITLMVSDLIGVLLAFYMATIIRRILIPIIGGMVFWSAYQTIVNLCLIFVVLSFLLYNLYPGYGLTAVKEFERLSKILSFVFVFLLITLYFIKTGTDFPRSIFILAWVFSMLFIPFFRFILRNRLSLLSCYGKPVAFIFEDENQTYALDSVIRCRRMGWNPIAGLFLSGFIGKSIENNIEIVSNVKDIIKLRETQSVDTVIFATKNLLGNCQEITRIYRELNCVFSSIIFVSSAFEFGSIWVQPRDLEGRLGLELNYHLLNSWSLLIKRAVDIIGSIGILAISFPLWLVISLLLQLDSQGPLFYSHQRIGKSGEKFDVFKFRTMVKNADQKLNTFLEENPEANKEWEKYQKLENDPRITYLGKFLRKFSLDELPQILNVLKGEMSLIGPRAVTEEEIRNFGPYAGLILRVKPGITGWWQVMGRNEKTWKERTRLEVYYVSNWSLWMDAYITIKTIWVIVSGQGK